MIYIFLLINFVFVSFHVIVILLSLSVNNTCLMYIVDTISDFVLSL